MKLIMLARVAASLGSGMGILTVIGVAIGQLNLVAFLQGRASWRVVELGSNALPFLSLLLLLCLVVIGVALRWQDVATVGAAIVWLGVGVFLFYAVYLARFSIGPFLIPPALLVTLAGALTAVHAWRQK